MKLPFKARKEQGRRAPQLMEGQEEFAFRRSRTLTGTTSEEIRHINSSEAQLKTPRLKLHELHSLRRRLVTRLVGLLVLIGASAYLLLHSISFISSVAYTQPPLHTQNQSAYLQTIHDYLAGHPLEEFDFNLDTNDLSGYVASKHPEVKAIGLTDGQFVVTLRKPILVWRAAAGTFYVDGSGQAFDFNAYDTPSLSVVDNSGVTAGNIGAVASGQFITFLGRLVTDVNALGLGDVAGVTIPPNTIKELDLKLFGRPYTIKTNVDTDPAYAAEDIGHSIRFLEGRGIVPAYIDNRVDGKAFYQ